MILTSGTHIISSNIYSKGKPLTENFIWTKQSF